MHAFRKGGHSEPRILYWFRTPPYVKVGRTAIDEEAIRMLEERHPDVVFDWARILREPPQQMTPAELEKRREQREAREAKRRRRLLREAEAKEQHFVTEAEAEALEQSLEAEALEQTAEDEGAEAPSIERIVEEAEAAERGGAGPDLAGQPTEAGDETSELTEAHPLAGLVGPEGLVRLRARHASLMARIAEVPDEGKREALRLAAERLDPDMWVTEAEARQALESYEASYEALRAQLGRKRRRRRRRRSRGQNSV